MRGPGDFSEPVLKMTYIPAINEKPELIFSQTWRDHSVFYE